MPEHTPSILLLETWLDERSPRMLAELRAATDTSALKGFARKWARSRSPFARQTLRDYIADGCDQAGHRPLVKALFKACEAADDAEAMGWFLVAFDRLAPKQLVAVVRWDWRSASAYTAKELRLKPTVPRRGRRTGGRFGVATRRYLARRALRWFRQLGFRDLRAYRAAIVPALIGYDDAHVSDAGQLLSAWGLMHILYWGSDALRRPSEGIKVRAQRSLSELQPAPLHPQAWADAPDALLDLVCAARASVVRAWAVALLQRAHPAFLRELDLAAAERLLAANTDEAVELGITALEGLSNLATVGLDVWLRLLRVQHADVLTRIVALVEAHVSPERLRRDQLLTLAGGRYAPPAELGLRWLKQRSVGGPADVEAAMQLADAPAPSVRADALAWITQLLDASPFAQATHVRDLLDARHPEARAVGLGLLESDRWRDAPLLWAALPETPYPDVRTVLMRHLRAHEAGYPPEARQRVWAAVLLAVQGGTRARGQAVRQIAHRLGRHPDEAEALLRLLGFALRSVRATDRRVALAAVTRAALADPTVRAAVGRHLPELTLHDDEAA